jgi:group I intron endonuclease
MGYIYYIKNLIDNKYYIGQTMNELNERWRQHKKKGSNCRYLKNAFKKYGLENFEFKLICICFDNDLDKFEIDYIKHYNSLSPNGYNLKQGGLGGGKLHQETKDKISKTLKELYATGYANPNIGRKHSEETKKKLSIAHLGRKHSDETLIKLKEIGELNMKRVLQYDLNDNIINIYKSGKDAANKNNTTKAGVSMACNGKRIQLKGFKYKYENEKNIELLNELKCLTIQKN